MKTGIIFDIKEFAVHDGPGARQTVFFKGCPLRCQWCHNPEGLSSCPQLIFSRNSCISCRRCVKACPLAENDIDISPGIPDGCTACGKCVEVCPLGLRQISGYEITSEKLAQKILQNADYYSSLGGGVTFSGGEPLMQGEFLIEVLDRLEDIHTAIETSAFASETVFSEVYKRLSFIMTDLKLMDPDMHRKYTGQDNAPILKNIEALCRGDKEFIIRIPLIPGINDSAKNMEQSAEFLKGAKKLLRVELLPYHRTAGAKYTMVNMKYEPDFDTERMYELHQDIFEKYSIRSVVL